MSLIFTKRSDTILRVGGAVVLALLLGGSALIGYLAHPEVLDTGYSPEQPVPFSHKTHAGNVGMNCYYCHSSVERSAYAAVPTAETCMNCHKRVKPQSPRLAMVRDSYEKGMPVPWVKVHRLPDFVYFNHQAHIGSGVSCVSCHGRIDQMVVVRQVEPLTMAWCLECHRNPSEHVRPVELVTNLAWDPGLENRRRIGQELIQQKGIVPPTHCSGCHR